MSGPWELDPWCPRVVGGNRGARLISKREFVMNGGMKEGDSLVFEWAHKEGEPFGCQISAFRGEKRLHWAGAGFLRDPSGRWLYAPYIRNRNDAKNFSEVFAHTCGFGWRIVGDTSIARKVSLIALAGESHRIILGDSLKWSPTEKSLQILRSQGTIDMNLYRPDTAQGKVLSSDLSFTTLPHHLFVIVRILAEANGFLLETIGHDTYRAVRR